MISTIAKDFEDFLSLADFTSRQANDKPKVVLNNSAL